MATFRVEDVAVKVDGYEIAASSLSFNSSSSRAERRRYGQLIESTGLDINGPQKSSLTMEFFLTGSGSSIFNPILNLLSGKDMRITSSATYPSFLGVYKPYDTGRLYIQQNGADTVNFFLWDAGVPAWSGLYQDGSVAITAIGGSVTDDIFDPNTTGAMSPSIGIERVGFMGCMQGSDISFGTGNTFASGAALTNLTISIQPFAPIACRASFDIYNKVSSHFETGASSFSIDPRNIAHGLYSTYSGSFGVIDEVTEIQISYDAQRAARYMVGREDVDRIDTVKASKTVTFAGFGRSDTLEQASSPFTITLGSQNQSNIFTDTVNGLVIDDSFTIPNVGIISKNIKIIQNMV